MKKIGVLFATVLLCASLSAQDWHEVPGKVIPWSKSFCSEVKAGINNEGQLVNSDNTLDNVQVSCIANTETKGSGEGFMGGSIHLSANNTVLTFSSSYEKNFTRIEIRGTDMSGVHAVSGDWRWETDTTFVWFGDAQSVELRGNDNPAHAIQISNLSIVFELNHGDTVYWIPSQLPAWDMDNISVIGEIGVGEYYTDLGLGIRGIKGHEYTAESNGSRVILHGPGEDPFSFIRDFEANFRKIELHYVNNDVQLDEFTDWTIDTEKQLVVWEGNNSFVDFGGRVEFDKAAFIVDPSSDGPQFYQSNDTLYVSSIHMQMWGCEATHLVLCEGITRLKKETFVSGSMQTLHCPASLRRFGYQAFAQSALNKVTFAENSVFQVLDHGAFAACTALPYIELPASLNRIAVYAFDGCTNLRVVTLHSPECFLEGSNAFDNCPNLQYIYVPAESVDGYKSAANWSAFASKIRPLPPSWLRPGDGWEAETGTLYVFSNPEADSYAGIAGIRRVVVDAAVTALGDGAFANCPNLKDITVKPTTCAAGSGVFDGCAKLEYIYVPVSMVDAYRTAADWDVYKNKIYAKVVWDMSKTSFRLIEKDASFTQDGLTLTAKTAYSYATGKFNDKEGYMDYDNAGGTCDTAFAFSSQVAKFTKIEIIGVGAAEAYRIVTAPGWTIHGDTVVWSQSEGVDSVFFGSKARQFTSIEFLLSGKTVPNFILPGDEWDDATKTLYLNSNPPVGGYEDKDEIKHVVVAANVTVLGSSAFRQSNNIQTVTFSEGSQLTTIGYIAFSGCSSLTAITIPAGVTTIGPTAFGTCTSLQGLTFAEGSQIETIEGSAFYGCSLIESVVFPETIRSIGYDAFFGCTLLGSVVIYAPSQTSYNNNAFGTRPAEFRIYVPAESVATYKTGWTAYQNNIFPIQEPTPTGIDQTNANANANANKFLRDGKLYLMYEGRMYDVRGQEITNYSL